jgi:3-dehydroquinate synthetase
MALTCALAVQLGLLDDSVYQQIISAFRVLGLPTTSELCTAELLMAGMDATCAQRGGALNLVVPVGIGASVFIAERAAVSRSNIESALDYLPAGGLVEAGSA